MCDGATRDRLLGALVGLAIGDALGTTVEFMPRGHFAPLTDIVGGGPFNLEPGQWTDDTAMAICLAESLLADPDFDAADLMRRFHAWWRHGVNSPTGVCFDIGTTTRAALARFETDGNPFAGTDNPRGAGNGSVMRLAPVAMRWWRNPDRAEAIAMAQSRTTHGAAEAVHGCALLARSLCGLIAGNGMPALDQDAPQWAPAIRAIGQGNYRAMAPAEIRASGYVGHTLQAAYWAVSGAETFADAVLTAANLGDDADTVAAVTGQLAGARFGYRAIPRHWRACLHDHARLLGLSLSLFAASEAETVGIA